MYALQPKVVTDIDEAELAKKLDQLEQENLEVAGDDDDEDEGSDEDGEEEGENADGKLEGEQKGTLEVVAE